MEELLHQHNGEIVVSKFSFFNIGKRFYGHRVWSVLSKRERLYEISLYHGSVPYIKLSGQCWNLYVSLVMLLALIPDTIMTVCGEIGPSDVNLNESVWILYIIILFYLSTNILTAITFNISYTKQYIDWWKHV